MKIGRTFYAKDRRQWRSWLKKNHRTAAEIWLIYYKKDSGRPRIPYDHAVEEALCFGWIDSTVKSIDAKKFAQRFCLRRPGSELSALNKERIRRLIAVRRMTRFGLERVEHAFQEHRTKKKERFRIAPDILKALRKDPLVWKNFSAFSETYRRIRVGWLDASRNRPDAFCKRLSYFVAMTAKNRRYGTMR